MPRRLLKIAFAALLLALPTVMVAAAPAQTLADRLKGHILLQVQSRGEAWYVVPTDGKRYYMKDGATAYQMMRKFSLGITDADLAKMPSVATTADMKASASICAGNAFAAGLRGKILLQVQKRGEAWYVDPGKCRIIYMADGSAAYAIMRYLSLGITNADLAQIPVGTLPETAAAATSDAAAAANATPAADAAAAAADAGASVAGGAQTTDTGSSLSATYVIPQNWSTGGGDALTDY